MLEPCQCYPVEIMGLSQVHGEYKPLAKYLPTGKFLERDREGFSFGNFGNFLEKFPKVSESFRNCDERFGARRESRSGRVEHPTTPDGHQLASAKVWERSGKLWFRDGAAPAPTPPLNLSAGPKPPKVLKTSVLVIHTLNLIAN